MRKGTGCSSRGKALSETATSLFRKQFNSLYRLPLGRFTGLVQQFPASEHHHPSHHGGMLDHGLEIVVYGLKLRQSHLLPVGAPPDSQAAQSTLQLFSVNSLR